MTSPVRYGSGAFRLYVPVMEHLEAQGVDVALFLTKAGLSPDLMETPDARVHRSEQEAIWRHALAVTGDPLLPARVAKDFPPEGIGVLIYLAKVASDGIDAIARLRNLVGLMQDESTLALEFEPGIAVLQVRNLDGYEPILPGSEYNAALHVFLARSLSVGIREPLELRIPHPEPAHAAEYEAFVGVPVRYGADHNGVVFPREEFDKPLPTADEGLSDLLERYAMELLERIPSENSFVDRVCAVVRPRLPEGSPGIEEVADLLHMSGRTVRRKLEEEGTTYRGTLDTLRRELAVRALEAGKESMDAIAADLGFSDTSAFYKAFRRWTGQSPADFSRGHR